MGRDRAAYMREYRAKRRQRESDMIGSLGKLYEERAATGPEIRAAYARIADLEAEVVRLKRELASRPEPIAAHAFNSRSFQPVPKHK